MSKTMTYAEAFNKIKEHLVGHGWRASDPKLVTTYVTSPNEQLRLWFKPQSIHYTTSGLVNSTIGTRHAFGNARKAVPYDVNIRDQVLVLGVEAAVRVILTFCVGQRWKEYLVEPEVTSFTKEDILNAAKAARDEVDKTLSDNNTTPDYAICMKMGVDAFLRQLRLKVSE